jgi:hypothetical protein
LHILACKKVDQVMSLSMMQGLSLIT